MLMGQRIPNFVFQKNLRYFYGHESEIFVSNFFDFEKTTFSSDIGINDFFWSVNNSGSCNSGNTLIYIIN